MDKDNLPQPQRAEEDPSAGAASEPGTSVGEWLYVCRANWSLNPLQYAVCLESQYLQMTLPRRHNLYNLIAVHQSQSSMFSQVHHLRQDSINHPL